MDDCVQVSPFGAYVELGSPMKHIELKNRSRIPLAITLIAASFVSAFLLATFSNTKHQYWVALVDLPAGHQIVATDLELSAMNLEQSADIYLPKVQNPVGQVLIRNLNAGQIVDQESISSTTSNMASSAVPLSVRSVDVAAGIQVGESVDIYWVADSQNGVPIDDPMLILGGVIVLSANAESKNFGTDAALTVAVEETQVLRLLSATTYGRLVVIRSHV